jgi:hypothetical protein
MVKRILPLLCALLTITLIITGCEEKSSVVFDEQNFTKIYDNNQFSVSYYPIDVQQTDDGGYLILGERKLYDSAFRLTYLVKVDKYGNFEKDLEVDENFVNPVGKLTKIGASYYFFCMDGNTLAYLASVDEDLSTDLQTVPVGGGGIFYPSASTYLATEQEFVLSSYNDLSKQSAISVVDITGATKKHKSFSIGIGEDVEEPIINHFIHTGKQLPFDAGRVPGGLYYFNGFYNYTLSLVFTDFPSDEEEGPNGVVNGQQENGGLSAVLPLGANKFAVSRFNFGDNYFQPNAVINTSAVSSAIGLLGNKLPELVPDARVRIIRATTDTKSALIYASDTRSRQIGLFFYDEVTGEFISSRYLGFFNPFELASIIQTADGGIAVCGTTFLAGRFPRICLFKLSKSDLEKNIKK